MFTEYGCLIVVTVGTFLLRSELNHYYSSLLKRDLKFKETEGYIYWIHSKNKYLKKYYFVLRFLLFDPSLSKKMKFFSVFFHG